MIHFNPPPPIVQRQFRKGCMRYHTMFYCIFQYFNMYRSVFHNMQFRHVRGKKYIAI